MRFAVLSIGLLVAFPLTASADGFKVTPGKYETTSTMKMPMMPNGMQRTIQNCVTPEEANRSAEDLAADMAGEGSCSATNVEESATSISFKFSCTGGDMGNMKGSYEMKGSGGSFTFKGKMSGDAMEMSVEGTSKRIGDC